MKYVAELIFALLWLMGNNFFTICFILPNLIDFRRAILFCPILNMSKIILFSFSFTRAFCSFLVLSPLDQTSILTHKKEKHLFSGWFSHWQFNIYKSWYKERNGFSVYISVFYLFIAEFSVLHFNAILTWSFGTRPSWIVSLYFIISFFFFS